MKPIDRADVNRMRFILTLLTLLRCVEGLEEPDIEAITRPSTVSNKDATTVVSKRFIKRFLKSVGHKPGFKPSWSGRFHFTTKMGPNGHAMSSTAADAVSLTMQDQWDLLCLGGSDLFTRFQGYLGIANRSHPGFILDVSGAILSATACRPWSNPVSAKLVAIPAPEGKTRIIAQLDYWSQEALKPLHDYVMKLLRRIPNDLTYRQSRGPSVMTRQPGHSFWSIDLKSATDRFPIMTQFTVLETMFGTDFAWAWYMTLRRPFKYGDEFVTYQAGQPMGSYSSWAVFALCHHIII
jgi:hypothetical protein